MPDQNSAPFPTNDRVESTRNHILSQLPKEQYERLLPFLEPVPLNHGACIYRPEERIEHVYFPIGGMISVTAILEDGKTVEIGTVGKEGMAGIDVVLGVDHSPHESIVQIPGSALRMKTDVVRSEFKQCGELQDLLLRYSHALLIHASQAGVCNRAHTVEQKLATWLMIARDRVESDYLPLTQEFIAQMLGVNRPTVSTTAFKFQSEGVIEYSRGKIHIVDPKGLENLACECYQMIKGEYAHLRA